MADAINYYQVDSPDRFQELLSKDLSRVSVLNFRASWAEPCAQMDALCRDLAGKFPQVLFLEIEAEALPDVSESFDVESVPHFVLLRGHTLLDTINGAQPQILTKSIEKHANKRPAGTPLSTSSKQPVPGPRYSATNGADHSDDPYYQAPAPESETEDELTKRCQTLMEQAPVVLFMKGNPDEPRCGFSNQTIKILRSENVEFKTHDILQDESARQHLKAMNDWPTFPQIIVKGEFVGGLDILKEMVASGDFRSMVED